MDNKTIFTKTAKGLGEAVGKTKALSRDLRKVIKEVDGQASFADLLEKLDDFSENKLTEILNKLMADDYIREFHSRVVIADNNSQFPVEPEFENSLTVLTMGAFLRELEKQPQSSGRTDAGTTKASPSPVKEQSKTEAEQGFLRASAGQAKKIPNELTRQNAAAQARKEAEEQAKREAEAKAQKEAEQRALQSAQEQAKKEVQANAKREVLAKAKKETEQRALQAAQAQSRKEAEQQARLAAEIAAKQEAERVARQAAEELARKEAEQQAKLAAETLAKEEAEQRARQIAEELAKKEAEEKARLAAEAAAKEEAERLARQAAEEQARKEAEQQAKLAAETLAKEEAEQRARQIAEELAKKEAEQQARLAAEAAAKEEAERLAKLAAEELARKEAEQQAKLAAEALAKEAAEQRARQIAEEFAKEEAEQEARLAAEAAAEAAAREEALAFQEAEALAKREAEQELLKITSENLQREAEEQAQLELEQQTHRAVQQELAELQALEQERQIQEAKEKAERLLAQQQVELLKQEKIRQTQAEAQERAQERTRQRLELKRKREAEKEARRRERLATSAQRDTSYPSGVSWIQIVLGFGIFLIVGFFAWARLSDFGERLKQFENAASEQFQQPVKIEALHFSFLPQPHWQLEKVRIGAQAQITVQQVSAVLDRASLLEKQSVLQSLDLQSPVFNQEGLGWLLFGKNQGQGIAIKQVTASNLTLDWPELKLGAFELRAGIGKSGAWQNMSLLSSNGEWQIELQPKDDLVQIKFNTKAFALPFGSKLNLSNFSAEGVLDRSAMTLTRFYGVLNDGTLTGSAKLGWRSGLNNGLSSGWNLKGELRASQIKAALALPTLFESGVLEGHASFAMQAKLPDQLFASSHMTGSFAVRDGSLRGVHLVNLIQGVDHAGTSAFKDLSGGFTYEGGRTHFRNVSLSANLVSANGDAQLAGNEEINARFVVELNTPVRQAQAVLLVSGNLKQPQFKRQTEGVSAPLNAPAPN